MMVMMMILIFFWYILITMRMSYNVMRTMIHMNMIIRTIIIMSIFMIFRIMSWLLLVAGTRQHGDGLSKIRPWICNLLLFFFLHSDVSCRQRGVMGWEHDGGWYVYAWWRYWLIHDGWDMVVDMSLSLSLSTYAKGDYLFFLWTAGSQYFTSDFTL